MKYKLLAVTHHPEAAVNIGDYVQAVASSQFYPQVDGFVDRDDELNTYDGEPCKMIMNGWYMHYPQNWPPTDKIDPLFVAFHLNSVARDQLLADESLAYLKRHEPIGCRDLTTTEMLRERGLDAYFSGCMTLTLGYKYGRQNVRTTERTDEATYIVDPLYNGPINAANLLSALQTMLAHPADYMRLLRNPGLCLYFGRNFVKRWLYTALYYKEYVRLFGRDLVMNSTYITQESTIYRTDFHSDAELLKEAERLVRLYARARLVITSRIHCALPCLGLETPVVYIERGNDSESSRCRLGGLLDLFNRVSMEQGKLVQRFHTDGPIRRDNPPVNKDNWRPLAQALIKRCTEFINGGTAKSPTKTTQTT